jgi:hypothetical protein
LAPGSPGRPPGRQTCRRRTNRSLALGNHDCDAAQASDERPTGGKEGVLEILGPRLQRRVWGEHLVLTLDANLPGGQLDSQQLVWVQDQLAPRPAGSTVVFGIHASVHDLSGEAVPGKRWAALQGVLRDDLRYVEISGHTHSGTQFRIGSWQNYNVSALCGNWWRRPHGLTGDGLGFDVFIDTNGDIQRYHQSVLAPLAVAAPSPTVPCAAPVQMRVADLETGETAAREVTPTTSAMTHVCATLGDHHQELPVFVEPQSTGQPWAGPGATFRFTLFATVAAPVELDCNGLLLETITDRHFSGTPHEQPFANPAPTAVIEIPVPATGLRQGWNCIAFRGSALMLGGARWLADARVPEPFVNWLTTMRQRSPVERSPVVWDTGGTSAPHFCLLHKPRFYFELKHSDRLAARA